jgi:hypothetical protein
MDDTISHDKHGHWSYKYIGQADADKLEYILMDIEAYNALNSPSLITDESLQKLREVMKDKPKLKIYYSEQFKQFIIEPY